MMHVLEEAWLEALQSEHARDLVEEILDLLEFGLNDPQDRDEAERLLKELLDLKEAEAVAILSEKIEKIEI